MSLQDFYRPVMMGRQRGRHVKFRLLCAAEVHGFQGSLHNGELQLTSACM